jgi:regulator of PEP synthase PpsR (kinase-PPPase family)
MYHLSHEPSTCICSDSTGETLEMIAKAALAQFEIREVSRHFWPMVRSQAHLDRVMGDIAANPGLVLYTMVNHDIRRMLEDRCRDEPARRAGA